MTPARCLDWCREFRASPAPLDPRTARNILEWFAAHAAKVAETDEDRLAVDAARQAAACTLKDET